MKALDPLDKAVKGAVKTAKATNALIDYVRQLEAEGGIANIFTHRAKLERTEIFIIINNGLTPKELEIINSMAINASYKVETTIKKAVIVLSNLLKLPKGVTVFTSTPNERILR